MPKPMRAKPSWLALLVKMAPLLIRWKTAKELTIKAVAPGEGQWTFKGWTGSEETSENITVTVDENMTLTANWVKEIP